MPTPEEEKLKAAAVSTSKKLEEQPDQKPEKDEPQPPAELPKEKESPEPKESAEAAGQAASSEPAEKSEAVSGPATVAEELLSPHCQSTLSKSLS